MVADLAPHLPEGQQTGEHVEQAVRSAQFQQSVGELGAAIAQDPSGAVISNLGLPGPAGGVVRLLLLSYLSMRKGLLSTITFCRMQETQLILFWILCRQGLHEMKVPLVQVVVMIG